MDNSIFTPDELAMSKIYSKNPEVISTYNDVYQKAKCTRIYDGKALTLSQMCGVAEVYLDRIGAKAPDCLSSIGEPSVTVSDASGIFRVSLKAQRAEKLRYGYVPETETADLEDSMSKPSGEEPVNIRNCTVKIENEKFTPLTYSDLYISYDGGENKIMTSSVTLANGISFAALLAEKGTLSFAKGIETLLDTLFLLLARGADRRHVGLCIKYGFPTGNEETRESSFGKGLATLLGAYRVMLELCLPDTKSDIILLDNSEESSILCTAYTDKPLKSISEKLLPCQSMLYLVTFRRRADGMPDFQSIREMCDYVHSLISSGVALCARAINGRVDASVRDAESGDYTIQLFEHSKNISVQGFIIQSNSQLRINPIGKVVKKEEIACDEQ